MSTSMLRRVGLDPALQAPLSAPVLRRPARSASASRARSRCKPRVPGLRRGGRGARRLDPGAGAQPVHGPARRASTSPTCSSATISAWSSTSRDRVVDHVSRPHRRGGADRRAVRARRTIPTRRRCSPRCRGIDARQAQLRADQGRDPVAAQSAAGLPFPSALPARHSSAAASSARLKEIAPGGARPAT